MNHYITKTRCVFKPFSSKDIGVVFGLASDAAAKASVRIEKLAQQDAALKTRIARVANSVFYV